MYQGGFIYPLLDRSTESIRLLSFVPDVDQSGPLRCVLTTQSTLNCPDYVALSYTWGEHGSEVDIQLNGCAFGVRDNLYAALRALRRFAHDPQAWNNGICGRCSGDQLPEYFWIDAICINQEDLQERGHQVDMMHIIYPKARLVVAWLGPSTTRSDTAFNLIKESHDSSGDASDTSAGYGWDTVEITEMATSSPSGPILEEPEGGWDEYWMRSDALGDLLNRHYWQRMWVIQEFVMAKNLVLISGNSGCYWKDLARYHHRFESEVEWAWRGASRLIAHRQYYQSLEGDPAVPLRRLLEWSRYGKCHDVRDKIYALMALATSVTSTGSPAYALRALNGFSRPTVALSSQGWKADYTISPIHLYFRVLSHEDLVETYLDSLKDKLRRATSWDSVKHCSDTYRSPPAMDLEMISRKSAATHNALWEKDLLAQLSMALEVESLSPLPLVEQLSEGHKRAAMQEYCSRVQDVPCYGVYREFRYLVHSDLQMDMESLISDTVDPFFQSRLDYKNSEDWGIFRGIIGAVSKWGSR